MYVFRQLKRFFWQDKRFLFGSLFGITMATALGLVYPVLLGVLIDDMILQGKYEGVTRLAFIAFGVVVLKLRSSTCTGSAAAGWATGWPTACATPATKNCRRCPSRFTTRPAPAI